MSSGHIDFTSWESGDPVDEEHLSGCEDCRESYQAQSFIRRQAARAPRIEPSPYFAATTARKAIDSMPKPWTLLLQRAAQQLLPVFALLMLTVGFLAFQQEGAAVRDDLHQTDVLAWVFEEQPSPSEMSEDEVFAALMQMEGASNEQSR